MAIEIELCYRIWATQGNKKPQCANFSLAHATPLLPAPTLSEGERSSLETSTGLPLYLVAFHRLLVSRHGGATGFSLELTVLIVACEMAIRILVCRLPWFYLSCPVSSSILTFPPPLTASHFLQTTAGMARKKIAGNELSAHVKANSYRRDTHRDRNSLRDRNKLGDVVKKDQNAALDLLCVASRNDCENTAYCLPTGVTR